MIARFQQILWVESVMSLSKRKPFAPEDNRGTTPEKR
jgi:hypothetical protein